MRRLYWWLRSIAWTWRAGRAMRWVAINNVSLRYELVAIDPQCSTTMWIAKRNGDTESYYSGDILLAIQYARERRRNPYFPALR